MGEEGVIHKHLTEIFHNAGGAAEKEAVYPAESCGCLPQSQKEEQENQSSEGDSVMMPVVGAQEAFLLRGDRWRAMRLSSHRLIPPIID